MNFLELGRKALVRADDGASGVRAAMGGLRHQHHNLSVKCPLTCYLTTFSVALRFFLTLTGTFMAMIPWDFHASSAWDEGKQWHDVKCRNATIDAA